MDREALFGLIVSPAAWLGLAFWGGLQANGKGVSTECAQADRSPEYRLCGRKLGVRFELSNTHGETTLWSAFRGTSAFEVTMVVRPFLTRLPARLPACLPVHTA